MELVRKLRARRLNRPNHLKYFDIILNGDWAACLGFAELHTKRRFCINNVQTPSAGSLASISRTAHWRSLRKSAFESGCGGTSPMVADG